MQVPLVHHNRRPGSLALAVLLLLGGSCSRLADEPYDFEALKLDACMDTCDMLDTCDPDRFVGMEPENCLERCLTLLPRLDEENQCASREIIYLECLAGLTCEEHDAFTEARLDIGSPPDYAVPCVMVADWRTWCSDDQPFDPDEAVGSSP